MERKTTRVNGFDMYSSPTRVDKMSDRKLNKGFIADTFSESKIINNNIDLVLLKDEDENDSFEEIIKNPSFGVSVIKGASVPEGEIIHSYKFKHSIGDVNFIQIDTVQFGDFGIKVNDNFIDTDHWNYIISEDFEVANGNPSAGGYTYHYLTSTGDELQQNSINGVNDIQWTVTNGGSYGTTTTYKVSGDQAIYGGASLAGYFIASIGKKYTIFELSAYVIPADTGSEKQGIVIAYNGYTGYSSSPSDATYLEIDGVNNTLKIIRRTNGTSTTIYTLDMGDIDMTGTTSLFSHFRVVVINKLISVYYNSKFVDSLYYEDLQIGDVGLIASASGFVDDFRMRVLPTSVIGIPPKSKIDLTRSEKESLVGSHGTQQRAVGNIIETFKHGVSEDSQLHLTFDERIGNKTLDKSGNENHGLITNGSWSEDGFFEYSVDLENGNIKILDDSSISDLSRFALHTRFRLQNLETEKRSLQANPIIQKGHEFIVYDYYDGTTHYIAFEIYGELLIGDEIVENEWNEFWFLCEGKSSFIYRRQDNVIIAEARKVLGDLELYMPLDADFVDYSIHAHTNSNSGGTITSSGKLNGGADYESTGSNRTDIMTDQNRSYVEISIACWFKAESILGATNSMLNISDTTNTDRINIIMSSGGVLYGYIQNGATSSSFATPVTLIVGYWYHLLMTYDGTTCKVYCNGVEVASSTTVTGNLDFTGTQQNSISSIGTGNHCDGIIDDVRVYSKALTQEEIDFLYSKGNYTNDLNINSSGYETHNRESGLIAHYKLNGNAKDSSIYEYDGSASSVTYSTGKLGKAGTFNGSAYINSANDLFHGYNFSIALWVKVHVAGEGSHRVIIAKEDSSYNGWELGCYSGSSSFRVTIQDKSANTIDRYNVALYNTDEWTYVVLVYTNQTFYLYVNNVLADTYSNGSLIENFDVNESIQIGARRPSYDSKFDGDIDDIRIYDYILSEDEMSTIYNSGNGTEDEKYKKLTMDYLDLCDTFYHPYKHLDSLIQVRNWKASEDSITNPNMNSLLLQLDFEEGEGLYSTIKKPYGITINYSDNSEWITDVFSPSLKYSNTQPTLTKTILLNDGDIFNDARIYEATWSIWVKWIDTTNQYIFRSRSYSDTVGILVEIRPDLTPTNNYIRYEGVSGSYNIIYSAVHAFDGLNKWMKLDIVFDHGTMYVYENGELITTNVNSNGDTYIVKSSTDYKFDIATDLYRSHFKIYDRALTTSEIKQSFITDPVNPYFLDRLVFSKKHKFNRGDHLFVENGLFGIEFSKGLYSEALRTVGKVQFKLFDGNWEDVGSFKISTVTEADSSQGVRDFQILETTPTKTIVRVWFEDSDSQTSFYTNDRNNEGEKFVFDFILEAGKLNATIIPHKKVHYQYNIGINFVDVEGTFVNHSIIGLNLDKPHDVGSSVENTTPELPIMMAFRQNDNLIIGFGSNEKNVDMLTNDDSLQMGISHMIFYNLEEDVDNDQRVYTVFANKYYRPDDTNLVFFVEAEDIDSDPTADATASNDFVKRLDEDENLVWNMGLLKKGSYIAYAYLKCSVGLGSSNEFIIKKDTTTIENYKYNHGVNYGTDFDLTATWTLYKVPFYVDDETVDYKLDFTAGNGFGTLYVYWDYSMLIPLSNGISFPFDLFLQGFTINNLQYIGAV